MFKRLLKTILIVSILFSVASLCAYATETEVDGTTETAIEVEMHTEDSVIIRAEEMQDGMNNPHPTCSYSFVEEDGKVLLRLSVDEESGDPFVAFSPSGFSADEYKFIGVVARTNFPGVNFTIYYDTEVGGRYSENNKRGGKYVTDSLGWQIIGFDLSEKESWGGYINNLRFDFLERGKFSAGTYSEIAAIIFCKSAEELYDTSFELLKEIYPPQQILSDFSETDLSSFGSGGRTSVAAQNGNLIFTATGTSDPQISFSYIKLAETRGIEALTTDDFRYTVMRYRTSIEIESSMMELFIFTGDMHSPMLRVEGTYIGHSGDSVYKGSTEWRSVVVDMAEDDGLEANTALKYGWQGRGAFNGFRFDWCSSGIVNSYLEISDVMFFADENDANGFSAALSHLNDLICKDVFVSDQPEETTYDTRYDETQETEDVVMPWETETESESEETLPVFVEDTEEVTEDESETADDTESQTDDGEAETSGSSGGSVDENVEDEESESGGEDSEGSQVPFFIACISLSCLSIASIVTVVVIRIKEKKANR